MTNIDEAAREYVSLLRNSFSGLGVLECRCDPSTKTAGKQRGKALLRSSETTTHEPGASPFVL